MKKLFVLFIIAMCIMAFICVVLDRAGVKYDMLVMSYIGVPLCMVGFHGLTVGATWLSFQLGQRESSKKRKKSGKGKRKEQPADEIPEEAEDEEVAEDPIRLQCECGKRLKVAATRAGKKVKCPGCGRSVPIPT